MEIKAVPLTCPVRDRRTVVVHRKVYEINLKIRSESIHLLQSPNLQTSGPNLLY